MTKSTLEKALAFLNLVEKCLRFGKGYVSKSVRSFNALKSPQGLRLPSAFGARCRGLDHEKHFLAPLVQLSLIFPILPRPFSDSSSGGTGRNWPDFCLT